MSKLIMKAENGEIGRSKQQQHGETGRSKQQQQHGETVCSCSLKSTEKLSPEILFLPKAHLVNGLNGPNVQQLVVKEHSNAKGDVLVQEIVMEPW